MIRSRILILAGLLFSLLYLVSCSNETYTKTERGDQPDIYGVAGDDKRMNDAIEKANKTISEFKNAYLKQEDGCYDYNIKVKFKTGDSWEHKWVEPIKLENDVFTGVVGNEPEATTEVNFGDTIKVNNNKISDWMYTKNGVLVGGYTIRAICYGMSPEEKKSLEQQSGFIIEE